MITEISYMELNCLLPGKRVAVIIWSTAVIQSGDGHCYWTVQGICVL